MSDGGDIWDSSGAGELSSMPEKWREDLRMQREAKQQLKEDRLQWSVAPSTRLSWWTLTKTGADDAHPVAGPRADATLLTSSMMRAVGGSVNPPLR